MALPTGQISLSQVNTELGIGTTAAISLNQTGVRTLAQRGSGQVAMSDLKGKSNGPSGGRLVVAYYNGAGGFPVWGFTQYGLNAGSMSPASMNGIPVYTIEYSEVVFPYFQVVVPKGYRLPGTYLRIKDANGTPLYNLQKYDPVTGSSDPNVDYYEFAVTAYGNILGPAGSVRYVEMV